jgi:hypothetical protein
MYITFVDWRSDVTNQSAADAANGIL